MAINKSIKEAFTQFWSHVIIKCGDILSQAKTYTDTAKEDLTDSIGTVQSNLTTHTNNKSNPHSVTKAQIGLDSVDNTSDANKPVSTAQKTAIDAVQTNLNSAKTELTNSIKTVSNNLNNYLPLSAGSSKPLIGPLGLTSDVNYGSTLPTSGFTGQLFYLEEEDDEGPSLPTGGTAGQYLVKNSSTDGDASWKTLPSYLEKYPSSIEIFGSKIPFIDFHYNNSTADYTSRIAEYSEGTITIRPNLTVPGTITGNTVYGAVWNDYAEYRICNEGFCAGRVVCENGDDTLSIASERLQPGASIVSDTFGFAIGETEEAKCPIAVSGRVLAFPYEDRNTFIPGEAVCAAPNGTVSRMTREEVREYPERIVGTVSAIPNYATWGEGNVPVAGRIWIKVR